MHILQRLTKVADGLYCDLFPMATPQDATIREHYERNALAILQSDVAHYARLKLDLIDGTELAEPFGTVADIAGGHPKLASILDTDAVTVYDQDAKTYEAMHHAFIEAYPNSAAVEYVESDITNASFAPSEDLAIVSHLLEHLTPSDARALLKRLKTRAVIVYGPNVCTAAGDDWFHYRPADHITFVEPWLMAEWVEAAGYDVLTCVTYHHDMLVYGVRK